VNIETVTARVAVAGQADTVTDLRTIGRAILAYRDDHGVYPPAYLVDAQGHPLLSWRVLVLPYLGEGALYRKFDLTKPWDDPANRPLLAEMPAAFRDRAAGAGSPTTTSYAGVAGLKTVFPGGALDLKGGISRARVIDGDSMTTAVGPVGAKVAIPWTAPRDITTPASPHFGDPAGFDGPGGRVTPMLFLDGSVRSMPDDVDPEVVHSWTTIAGESCSPPTANAVQLHGSWDLDGNGQFETMGLTASLRGLSPGRHRVAFRVTEADGGTQVIHPTLTVR
jgi:hypothetical protein